MQTLRDYQIRSVDSVREAWGRGVGSVLLTLPTGAGKTTVGAALCAGHRVLWVAHRTELLAQAAARLESFGVDASVISAQSLTPLALVSVPTLIVLDECHHYPQGGEWVRTVSELRERGALVLGLTATPQRADGVGLGGTFDTLIVGATPRELVNAGHLCDVDVYAPSGVQNGLAATPREAWERYGEGRRTVVFCGTVADAEQERNRWGDGEVIHGALSHGERVRRLASPWRVLFNVQVLTEGWDVPEVKCAILARGCGSLATYLQIAGRILRPHFSYSRAVLIDLVGTSVAHGHPCDAREYTLDGTGYRAAPTSHAYCVSCGFLLSDSASECDRCGFKRETREQRERRITNARLEKQSEREAHTEQERVRALATWVHRSRQAGHKPMAAQFKFKGVYGRMPTQHEIKAAWLVLSRSGVRP